jgi:mannose-6-phosphate isomerase-like protein (cupin superfamily)
VLKPEDAQPVSNRSPTRVVKILLESDALDVTWSRFGPHEDGADLHIHREHEDAFYVLDGELTLNVGVAGEQLVIGPGTFACVPPGVVHGFANESDASVTYLNYHAPSMGFAAYLRGERVEFDQHEPPADGGLPVDGIVLRRS